MEAFWWLAIPVCFIGFLVVAGGLVRLVDQTNPYFQAMKFRKANQRFKEICSE
jgi:hypothetical protein